MTPRDFIRKWKAHTLTERQAAQTHFNDLCALIGQTRRPRDQAVMAGPVPAIHVFPPRPTAWMPGSGRA